MVRGKAPPHQFLTFYCLFIWIGREHCIKYKSNYYTDVAILADLYNKIAISFIAFDMLISTTYLINRFTDLMEYKKNIDAARSRVLDDLVEESQRLGFYD